MKKYEAIILAIQLPLVILAGSISEITAESLIIEAALFGIIICLSIARKEIKHAIED